MDAVDKLMIVVLCLSCLILGMMLGINIADEVSSKKVITPEVRVLIENGVSDSTYIYKVNNK